VTLEDAGRVISAPKKNASELGQLGRELPRAADYFNTPLCK